METDNLSQKFAPLVRQYWLPVLLAVLGMIFLGYGMIGYFAQKQDKPDILFEAASTSAANKDNPANDASAGNSEIISLQDTAITVDIEGAVQKPGVYELPADSRIQDVLIAAEGLAKDADRDRVAKHLNLAAKITDGTKIYIAYLGEPDSVQTEVSRGTSAGEALGGLININSASATELDSLSGVGPTTAEKIISGRPYNSIDELVDKKIVGKKVFTDIQSRITAQ